MLGLLRQTPPGWLEAVMADFDRFLIDHAACERKASATGMAFVVRYPDRTKLLEPMIELAKEELEHFHQVYRIIERRGLKLLPDEKDPYVRTLLGHLRSGRDERLMDRLLVGGIVEARGCERFGLVAEALPPGELKDLYMDFTRSEARHHAMFYRMAGHYFEEADIAARQEELLEREGEIMASLPFRAALH